MKLIFSILYFSHILFIAYSDDVDECPYINSEFFNGLTWLSCSLADWNTRESTFTFAFVANLPYGTNNTAKCLNITANTRPNPQNQDTQLTVTNPKFLTICQAFTLSDILNVYKCTADHYISVAEANPPIGHTYQNCTFTVKFYQIINGVSGSFPLATADQSFSLKIQDTPPASLPWTVSLNNIFMQTAPSFTSNIYNDSSFTTETTEFKLFSIYQFKIELTNGDLRYFQHMKHYLTKLHCDNPNATNPQQLIEYSTPLLQSIDSTSKGVLKFGIKLMGAGSCDLSTIVTLTNTQPNRRHLSRQLKTACENEIFGGTFEFKFKTINVDGIINKVKILVILFVVLAFL